MDLALGNLVGVEVLHVPGDLGVGIVPLVEVVFGLSVDLISVSENLDQDLALVHMYYYKTLVVHLFVDPVSDLARTDLYHHNLLLSTHCHTLLARALPVVALLFVLVMGDNLVVVALVFDPGVDVPGHNRLGHTPRCILAAMSMAQISDLRHSLAVVHTGLVVVVDMPLSGYGRRLEMNVTFIQQHVDRKL
jgi:hypothetical protein